MGGSALASDKLEAANAGLIGDTPLEIVLKNKRNLEEQQRVLSEKKYYQSLYLRNLIIFTFQRLGHYRSVAKHRTIHDRGVLIEYCGSPEVLYDLLKQMGSELTAEAHKKSKKNLKLIWCAVPIWGWFMLYRNREGIGLYNISISSTLNIKRKLERDNFDTDQLIRDFAEGILENGIESYGIY